MNIIRLSQVGILPDTDVTLALCKLFRDNKQDTTFVFENADYYLNPHEEMRIDYRISNSDVIPVRTLGLLLKEMRNCVLEGNGARLWFAGHMQPFTLDTCENIKVQDFTINWKKPMVAEAIVTSGGVKVSEIDPKTMASKIVPGLYFAGEIIDCDAYTGGFNLQIAWATGYAAGMAV